MVVGEGGFPSKLLNPVLDKGPERWLCTASRLMVESLFSSSGLKWYAMFCFILTNLDLYENRWLNILEGCLEMELIGAMTAVPTVLR